MRRKKQTLIWVLSVTLAFGICVEIGYRTRKSITDDTVLSDYMKQSNMVVMLAEDEYDPSLPDAFCNEENVEDLSDLDKKEVTIIKAKLIHAEDRRRFDWSVLSQVKVENVYQGNCKTGDILNLFEPLFLMEDGKIISVDGYQMMQEGQSYFLILKSFQDPGYGTSDVAYAPYSWRYGKFFANEGVQATLHSELKNEDGAVRYQDVCKEEVLLYDKGQMDKFKKIKKELLAKVKGEQQ